MIARSGKAIAEQLTIEGFYCDPDQRNAFLIIGDMSTIMGIVFVSCAHIISQVFLPLALILYPSELETCDRRLRRRCCGIGIIFFSLLFARPPWQICEHDLSAGIFTGNEEYVP